MDIFKGLRVIAFLFGATWIFCWVLTHHWSLGPITTLFSFLVGLALIGLLGISILDQEEEL